MLLLLHPDLHDELVGQQLGSQHLHLDAEAGDANILAPGRVFHGGPHHLFGGEQLIIIGDSSTMTRHPFYNKLFKLCRE